MAAPGAPQRPPPPGGIPLLVKVAFVTPELAPLVRRTNLATVALDLATSLKRSGCDVRIFMPRTIQADPSALTHLEVLGRLQVQDGNTKTEILLRQGQLGDLKLVLFENPRLFGDRYPYGDENGPYADNWRRYAIFARAVLEAPQLLNFPVDVFHCMDWTTGLIPLLHKLEYRDKQRENHPTTNAGTFFSISNLAMQGEFEREILPKIGVPHEFFRNLEGVEHSSKVNFVKAGAEFGTVVGTHSPTYAQTIQQRDRGYGLEDTFQRRKKELVGIHNGVDYSAWDPAKDPLLPAAFSAQATDLSGKARCKQVLQEGLRLDVTPKSLVACHIGRWDADSGFDLLAEVLGSVLERDIELIVMGQGGEDISKRLRTIEGTFVGRLRVIGGYDAAAAHKIMGGADLLLLPSHYQPANPLFAVALRYGVVPMIYNQGGLEQTLPDAIENPAEGLALHFSPYTGDGLLEGVVRAVDHFRHPEWEGLVKRGLAQDFSWEKTASEYHKAYRRVTRRIRGR